MKTIQLPTSLVDFLLDVPPRPPPVFDFAYFDFPEIGSAIEVLFKNAALLPTPEAVI